jgi:hypothetical protein
MSSPNKISLFSQIDIIELATIAFRKVSTWVLVISNLSIIFFAVVDGIGLFQILWIYWIQSVIIGIFNFIKIISLKEFSTEGLKQGSKPVEESTAAKFSIAIFFLIHYGIFHFVYAVFLSSGLPALFGSGSETAGSTYIYYATLIFIINYTIEFIYYLSEREPRPNLGKMMSAPYIRIIPMHLTIILGGFIGMGSAVFSLDAGMTLIIVFTLLKTFIDVVSHNTDSLNSALLKEKS